MRVAHRIVLLAIGMLVSCRQILGIEDAVLVCPPEMPNCTFCVTVEDCGSASECHSWACIDNLCTPKNVRVGTKCATGVCSEDPVSECVECVEYEDCPGGQCRDHVCSRCDDGIKNGWEADIDCGGGAPCKRCLGDACSDATQCKSGFCADGTCCDVSCDQICLWCNNPEGKCSALPKYSDDNKPLCDGNNVCDGFGACLLRPGEICIAGIECASFRCEQNRCRKLAGEECFAPQECANDLCVNGVCQN